MSPGSGPSVYDDEDREDEGTGRDTRTGSRREDHPLDKMDLRVKEEHRSLLHSSFTTISWCTRLPKLDRPRDHGKVSGSLRTIVTNNGGDGAVGRGS